MYFVALMALRTALVPCPDAKAELQAIAARLPCFCAGGFVYDRDPRFYAGQQEEHKTYCAAVTRLAATRCGVGQIVALLGDADPKLRTLAAAALFAREGPQALPHIALLLPDGAATFPCYNNRYANARPGFGFKDYLQPQTVADCVRPMIEMYLYAAGYSRLEEFEEYWATRKGRRFCASWFAVQLDRATQGASPIPEARLGRIRAVRRQVDALPAAERVWVLLYPRRYDSAGGAFLPQAERVGLYKSLGHEAVMRLLRREVTCDDPDLQGTPGRPAPRAGMILDILANAAELLRPEDADYLLERRDWERAQDERKVPRPVIGPEWTLAAAALRPDRAVEWLHADFARFDGKFGGLDQARQAKALWDHGGPDEADFLAKWFYRRATEESQYPSTREAFLAEWPAFSRDPGPLLGRLVADGGFDKLDLRSLVALVKAANRLVVVPLVDPARLHDSPAAPECRRVLRVAARGWSAPGERPAAPE